MGVEVLGRWWANRQLPPAGYDDHPGTARGSRYNDLYQTGIVRKTHAAAEATSYFTVNNGQTGIAASSTSDPSSRPFVVITNSSGATEYDGKRIYVDYANFITTAVEANGGNHILVYVRLWTALAPPIFLTQGTDLTAQIVNVDGESQTKSVAQIFVGANNLAPSYVASAQTLRRTIVYGRFIASPASGTLSEVVDNTYHLTFGAIEGAMNTQVITTAGQTRMLGVNLPPLMIAPQGFASIFIGPTGWTTPPSYLPELGWWEV